MMPLETAFLSLGSNLGDRRENLSRGVAEINKAGIQVLRSSSLYETEPQDMAEQPWFLNIVVEAQTGLLPRELLRLTQTIERDMGRVRPQVAKGPRLIDIDILLLGNSSVNEESLTIPHPRMTERRFVLEPLLEIAPDLRHPGSGQLFGHFLPGVAGQKMRKLTSDE